MRGRIRTIKPEALTDEELWDAEVETGFPMFRAFVGLWMYADREGRFEWRPRPLKAAILPYWDGDFSRVLDACVTRGFVRKYASEGREFGLVRTFHLHQVINNREEASRIPPPPSDEAAPGAVPAERPNVPPSPTRGARVDDASSTGEGREAHAPLTCTSGTEGKGREGKEEDPSPPKPRRRDPSLPVAPLPGVREVHEAWKLACGYPAHKFRGAYDTDAAILADAIAAYGLPDCLLVAAEAPNDGMVSGKRDEHGAKHDTIRYVFGNADAFARILRAAHDAAGKAGRKRNMSDAVAEQKRL